MKSSFIVSVVGVDRPGVVESVAQAIAEHGGNWESSRMTQLGDRFAGVVLASIEQAKGAAMQAALEGLESAHLQVRVEATNEALVAEGRRYMLEMMGHDRPGLMQAVSSALARHDVNVEELRTHCGSAPMSGEQMFTVTAFLRAPKSGPSDAWLQNIEQLADELTMDLTLQAVEG